MSLLLLSGCSMHEKPVHDPAFTPVFPVQQPQYIIGNGSIFQAGNNSLLQTETKAHRIGDLLTIVLQEKMDSQKSVNTATSKTSDVAMKAPSIFGVPITRNGREILQAQLNSDSSFSGDGSSKQSNSLTGNLTVTVVDVLANGNLMVKGEKVMRLNQGDEYIRFSGIVRPADISSDNSIISYKVANAEIIVGGNGLVANAGKAGWMTRFFQSSIWPF